jgi:hypothetical protein
MCRRYVKYPVPTGGRAQGARGEVTIEETYAGDNDNV